MAEDWIKMRTDLYRDPKVCVMADILMDPRSALGRYVDQHCQREMTVTRNVMRNVTVGALVSVWGVMRVRGKAVGRDLVCAGVTINVLDDISDLPGFGDAMSHVGWVKVTGDALVFPRFFEDYNVDPEGSAKEKSAERQRRFREKLKRESNGESDVTGDVTNNVTGDVTVTSHSNSREEKRREEEKHMSGIALEVLVHLNSKANRNFQPVAANTKLIIARIREGATLERLKAVVDAKVAEWLNDPKMEQYLRPATLFNAEKFGQYSGLLGHKPKGANGSSVADEYADLMRGSL